MEVGGGGLPWSAGQGLRKAFGVGLCPLEGLKPEGLNVPLVLLSQP
jgi:hypothetical protein